MVGMTVDWVMIGLFVAASLAADLMLSGHAEVDLIHTAFWGFVQGQSALLALWCVLGRHIALIRVLASVAAILLAEALFAWSFAGYPTSLIYQFTCSLSVFWMLRFLGLRLAHNRQPPSQPQRRQFSLAALAALMTAWSFTAAVMRVDQFAVERVFVLRTFFAIACLCAAAALLGLFHRETAPWTIVMCAIGAIAGAALLPAQHYERFSLMVSLIQAAYCAAASLIFRSCGWRLVWPARTQESLPSKPPVAPGVLVPRLD
jgi:hypothetical protein